GGDQPPRHLLRAGPLAESLVARRPDQHRPQPPPPVPGRPVVEHLHGRGDPLEYPQVLPLPRPDLRRHAGDDRGPETGAGSGGSEVTRSSLQGWVTRVALIPA